MKKIGLVNDTIDKQDIDELIGWLKTYPKLTKGELTIQLEKKWAKYVGTKYSVFVNSGSSANLLLLYALSKLNKNSCRGRFYEKTHEAENKAKIIVPAISWSTDLAPVIQLGMEPVLVDCNMNDLTIDLNHLNDILVMDKKDDITAIISVSVLGFSPDLDELKKFTDHYGIDLIEDNCEAMGTLYNGKHIGTHGIASTYSTYFGHHISTVEGGFVNTDDDELYNMLLMLRSHGWDRDLPEKTRIELRNRWKREEFDSPFNFYVPGFNLRSTEINAKLGLQQLKKLNNNVEIRNRNFNLYQELLWKENVPGFPGWKPKPLENSYVSNFAYPVIHPMKRAMVDDLQNAGVETRPLICGSLGNQPMYIKYVDNKHLFEKEMTPNADNVVDGFGFYVPNHPGMTENDVLFICDILNKYKGVSV
jgi:CDP-6-deoxy-D-xylo-4-hexulose-3-dehydrase